MDTPTAQHFKVPAALMQQVATYLSHQPYRDVAPMLNVIATLMPEPNAPVAAPTPTPAAEPELILHPDEQIPAV